jgi:predicted ArsR family transcriptional regulator
MSADFACTGAGRVLLVLKTKGPQTAGRIARQLGITTMAVRQHLAVLEAKLLIDFTEQRRKVGRPARLWRLTSDADDQFPNCHAELAVVLLQSIERSFGKEGVARVTEDRARQQAESYRARMPGPDEPIDKRVAALARLRREEGYMAESRRKHDGTIELVQNHCSIAKAARLCPKLCNGELSVLRAVLGNTVFIERTEHIVSGDRRCSYSIADRDHGRRVSRQASSSPD